MLLLARESKRCHWWSKATATQSIAASEATIAVEMASMNELDECSTTNRITTSIVPPSDYYPNKAPAELSSSVEKETRKIQIVCVFFIIRKHFKFYLFSAMSLSLSFKILYPCTLSWRNSSVA